MLSEEEKQFLNHWKDVREMHSSFSSKLKRGLPMAIIFSSTILVSVLLVYALSPDWFTKISQKAKGAFLPILIAIIGSIFFFAYVRMHFLWEQNEEAYQALKQKEKHLQS
jgi:hypothetical protein